jgi:hypothetical protein
MLQRGYMILIAGAALLIAGIIISIVWAGSFAGTFLRESTIIGQTLIKPSESTNASLQVNDIIRPVSIALHFKPAGSNVTLNEIVRDPTSKIVNRNTFLKEFFTTFKPDTIGKYTLTITNLGNLPVNVDGVFGYIPFINQNNQVNLSPLGGIIAGVILVIVGIITLIVGILLVMIDKRRAKGGKEPMISK